MPCRMSTLWAHEGLLRMCAKSLYAVRKERQNVRCLHASCVYIQCVTVCMLYARGGRAHDTPDDGYTGCENHTSLVYKAIC